ncbi:MAG: Uncharacterised protein [Marinobacterium sp. xm-d-530]|nr:MAG: Uncharacterised protein [Marinobacterium sp. xm-d-530]
MIGASGKRFAKAGITITRSAAALNWDCCQTEESSGFSPPPKITIPAGSILLRSGCLKRDSRGCNTISPSGISRIPINNNRSIESNQPANRRLPSHSSRRPSSINQTKRWSGAARNQKSFEREKKLSIQKNAPQWRGDSFSSCASELRQTAAQCLDHCPAPRNALLVRIDRSYEPAD